MLTKVGSVFLGFSNGDFVTEDGEKIDWCNAAFSTPGTADTFLLKVNQDKVDPDVLTPYRVNFLLVDFRYDKKYNTYKGYIVDVFDSEADMNASPLELPDNLRDDLKPAPKPAAPVSK